MVIRHARLGDAEGIAMVHIDSWRTTYKGIVPDEVLAKLSYTEREQRWVRILTSAERDNHLIFVAEDENGQIIGFAGGGPEREGDTEYKGELYAIYLLKESQGKGIGRLLTKAVANSLLQAGYGSMLVWVLADNPSRYFYERLGAKQVRVKQIEIGGNNLNGVAYGWPDVAAIIS